jgi:putative membrane protein insertion efficiency factor
MIRFLLIALLRIYQWTVSPFLAVLGGPGSGCRFMPSCSHYAVEALEKHGAWRGTGLTLRRVCRCHPWGGFGFDPVPAPRPSSADERVPALKLFCAPLHPPQARKTPTR